MEHLLLLKKVDLLRFLAIAFLVQSYELKKQVLTNLMHGLSHEYLALELRMHCQKWRAIKLLKCGDKDYLQVFDSQYVEMTQVVFCGTPIDEELTIDTLVKACAVWCINLW